MGAFIASFGEQWQVAANGPARHFLWPSALAALIYLVFLAAMPGAALVAIKTAAVGLLAIAAAARAVGPDGRLLAIALAFGAGGDAVIARPDGFVSGLAMFLAGHLVYIFLFLRNRTPWRSVSLSAKSIIFVLVAAAIALTAAFGDMAGALRFVVGGYTVALTAMAATAVMSRWPALASFGAILFLASDALIGIGRFVAPPAALAPLWAVLPYAVWALYYPAQLLLFLAVDDSRQAQGA